MRAVGDEVTDRLWNNLTVPLLVDKDIFDFALLNVRLFVRAHVSILSTSVDRG